MSIPEIPNIQWTRLPYTFNPTNLQADLAAIPDALWQAHFNARDFDGDWSILSLHSRTGRPEDIFPIGEAHEYRDTPLMAACPHLRAAVQTFPIPLKQVRLMRLHPGSRIKEHRDQDLGLEHGELRIHIPVETNPQVEFVVANQRLPLAEGESWYIDFSQPHHINNLGPTPRTHLVLDGLLNPWATAMLQRAAADPAAQNTITLAP